MPPARRGTASAAQPKPTSASFKKQARSIERLLKRQLPDNVRQQKEAQLAEIQKKEQKQRRTDREKHFSKKYHKVKFFERRKIERQIALLKRQLTEPGGASQAALEAKLEQATGDLLYVQHFPRHKKYLSLFPKDNAEDPYVIKRRARIRATIIRRAKAGQLDESDEEGSGDEDGVVETGVLDDAFFAGGEEEEEEEAVAQPRAPAAPARAGPAAVAAARSDAPREPKPKKKKRASTA